MKNLSKTLSAIALAATALFASASASASSVAISYGGQTATDGSGLTSVYVPANNVIATPANFSGYFLETFDTATRMFAGVPGLDATPLTSVNNFVGSGISFGSGSGCGVNGYLTAGVSTSGGGMGVQQNSSAAAAKPYLDSTCFAYAPGANPNGSSKGASVANPATIKLDYAGLLSSALAAPGAFVNYIGFYLGSIDVYNDVLLYSGATLKQTISGTQLLGANLANQGSQNSALSNIYVNLAINSADAITAIAFRSTGIAVEMDNLVVGLGTAVPEPESLALMGLGLVALAASRRRKQAC